MTEIEAYTGEPCERCGHTLYEHRAVLFGPCPPEPCAMFRGVAWFGVYCPEDFARSDARSVS